MDSKFRKCAILLIVCLLLVTSCRKTANDSIIELGTAEEGSGKSQDQEGLTKVHVDSYGNTGVVKVGDIKEKYGTKGEFSIKPFYNVEQTTQFTFHFNSKVEPCKAITVHTDSKCGIDSMVYQINDGYVNPEGDSNGMSVVVKPGRPVLSCEDRIGNIEDNYCWGNAPIYYLCIRMDLFSTTPTVLDEPIIVPFTVRSTVSVPTAIAKINSDGQFTIEWNSIEGADSYNIYRAYQVRESSPSYTMTRAEAGFVGDHLEKFKTVDSGITTLSDFGDENLESNLTDENGRVYSQNQGLFYSYYITAVDSQGNESFFSYPISAWQFKSQTPREIESTFMRFTIPDDSELGYLPQSVPVRFDDDMVYNMPVRYEFLREEYDTAYYEYHVIGTLLSGEVEYKTDGNYPDTIESDFVIPEGVCEIQNNINIVPTNDVSTIIDEEYSGTDFDLASEVSIGEEYKIEYSSDALYTRADLESARIINDGVYTSNPMEVIDTYISEEGFSSSGILNQETSASQELGSDSAHIESESPSNTAYDVSESETESSNRDNSVPDGIQNDVGSIADNITSDNLVSEQIDSTNKQVETADEQEITVSGHVIFADSAEEEYLAIMMIGSNEVIDLKAFPSLQNPEYLLDVIYKVIYQNPYIIGVSGFAYYPNEQALSVEYMYGPEENARRQKEIFMEAENIVDTIIKDGMSEEDKVMAIWEYLEDNTEYDFNACEQAERVQFVLSDLGVCADAFNTYGIMVNKVGVCQSYANTFRILADMAGLNCLTLTGYINRTLPHAWNAVEFDGKWYWVDTTNNFNVTGINYMLYQASSDFAESIDYVLDDMYALDNQLNIADNSDSSRDYYYQHNLVAENDTEVQQKLAKEFVDNGKTESVAVRCTYVPNCDNEEFIESLFSEMQKLGVVYSDVEDLRMGYANGYMVLVK